MITLQELQNSALNIPDLKPPPSLPHLLMAWALEDPGKELDGYLKSTGLDCPKMVQALLPLVDAPDSRDRWIITECTMEATEGPVTGRSILKKLSKRPEHRITSAFVQAGLDLSVLEKALGIRNHSFQTTKSSRTFEKIDIKEKLLLHYGRELTREAAQGCFDNLCDRAKELDRIFSILMKKTKGHGVITGPAGVGKTALVELLARSISLDRVPKSLKKMKIYEISMTRITAGTVYRGQFEERFEKVIRALESCQPAIGFIDELHLVMGAGRAEGAPMDAANILKPALSRGRIKILGATTVQEYQRFIASDSAFARRFEEIKLTEPDQALVMDMVARQSQALEAHHGISIPQNLVAEAVNLTNNYLPNRWQPDKAADLLDAAAAVYSDKNIIMTREALLQTLARQTNLPIAVLQGQDRHLLQDLAARLRNRIIGQDHVIDTVVSTLIYRRQGLGSNGRCLGTFLFAGSTGVGKTELARNLAAEFFGAANKLLHLDLAEYNDNTAVNKLIGVPPGYVGQDKDGALADFLHTHAAGVILFDEIEKAHSEIHNLFLGLLDNGRIRTSRGELLDCRQSVVVLTTNALEPKALNREKVGFGRENVKPDPVGLLLDHFPREFLSRFDEIMLFNDLGLAELKTILWLRLEEALKRLTQKRIKLDFDQERLIDHLLQQIQKNRSGARGIARLLEKCLLQQAAMALLNREDDDLEVTLILDEAFYSQGDIRIKS